MVEFFVLTSKQNLLSSEGELAPSKSHKGSFLALTANSGLHIAQKDPDLLAFFDAIVMRPLDEPSKDAILDVEPATDPGRPSRFPGHSV